MDKRIEQATKRLEDAIIDYHDGRSPVPEIREALSVLESVNVEPELPSETEKDPEMLVDALEAMVEETFPESNAKAEPDKDDGGESVPKIKVETPDPIIRAVIQGQMKRLDIQRQEIERLKNLNDAYEQQIDRLTVENKTQAEEIERLKIENKRLDRWHDYFAWEREMKKVEAKNRHLNAENAKLKEDNKRYSNRDGKATIRIMYPQSNDPFHRETCEVIDFGVMDNSYIIEAEFVKALAERIKKLEKALIEIRDAEPETCDRCEGSGIAWADGKAHKPSYDGPTIDCGDCSGTGKLPLADAKDIAEQTLADKENADGNDSIQSA